jgi:hypothetical protein
MAAGGASPFHNPAQAGSDKGACIWCGNPGKSREDIISRWVDKAFELPPGWSSDELVLVKQDDFGSKRTPVSRIANKSAASRGVCPECNSGWMSRLESEVKPSVARMMNGREASLSPSDQLTIATWASMKAICYDGDYRNKDSGLSSVEARTAVFEHRRPPAHFAVLLGAYCRPGQFFTVLPYGQGTGEKGQPLTQWVFTMLFGHLIVQVQGKSGAVVPGSLEVAPNGVHLGDRFTVWPPQPTPVSWPPAVVLDVEQVREFIIDALPALQDSDRVRDFQRDFKIETGDCASCGESHDLRPAIKLPVR